MANAIMMASGMGTRMRPLTLTTPKPLIKVNNKPMIESVLETLKEAGVEKIFVVVGYLGDQFEYLKDKYDNLEIIKNGDYETINNISSIYYAREALKLGDTYICEADLFVKDVNFVKNLGADYSGYFGTAQHKEHSDDWGFMLDDAGYITKIAKGGNWDYNMCGMSFFKKDDASKLAGFIEARYNTEGFEDLFWDDVVNENLDSLKIKIHEIKAGDITEIDTVEELEEVNKQFS